MWCHGWHSVHLCLSDSPAIRIYLFFTSVIAARARAVTGRAAAAATVGLLLYLNTELYKHQVRPSVCCGDPTIINAIHAGKMWYKNHYSMNASDSSFVFNICTVCSSNSFPNHLQLAHTLWRIVSLFLMIARINTQLCFYVVWNLALYLVLQPQSSLHSMHSIEITVVTNIYRPSLWMIY